MSDEWEKLGDWDASDTNGPRNLTCKVAGLADSNCKQATDEKP